MAGNACTQPVKQNPDSTPAKTFPFAVPSPNFVVFRGDFPRARRNTGQGNACQGNVGHSADTHSLDKAVLANLGVLRVELRPFHLRDLGSRQELMVSWVPYENASGFVIYEVEPARRVSIVNRKWG